MSIELGRRLIAAGAVPPSEIEAAFHRQLVAQIPFVRALLELGYITEEGLERELANGKVPFLATVVPLPAIVDELPSQMCRRLMAVPVRRDPRTGLVDVAAVDPFDAHVPYEFSFHLKNEVRVLRGSLADIEQALTRIDRGEYSASVILRKSARPPGYATPSAPPLRSDRPIPLVRRVKRGQPVEVHPVRNVSGPARDDKTVGLPSTGVPPAPSVPSFGGRPSAVSRPRQHTAPGPPGVPPRQSAPVPTGVRGRPAVPASVPSARGNPQAPSGSSPVAKARPDVSGPAKGRPGTSGKSPPPPKPVAPSRPPSVRASSSRASASGALGPSASRPLAGASSAPAAKVPRAAPAAAVNAPGAKRRSINAPPTQRGPHSPKVPTAPFADIRAVLAAMQSAATRDDVIDCLIVGMSTVARRVGVFAVKKGHYRGVACNAELGDPTRFRRIEISTEEPTVLGIAAVSGSYVGPLPVTPPHEDLLAIMKDASTEVAASLIRVAGRPAVILFADGVGDTKVAARRAEELGQEASLALSRIVTEAKANRGPA